MLMIFLWTAVLIISLVVLVKAADFFTESAEKIGIHFGMSPFIVGVTIVAIGTSLPELISSMVSVFAGASEIVIGNVVGSNIANVFLILGITAIVGKKLKIAHELMYVDLPLFIGSAFLLAAMIWDGSFTLFEAIVCLAALVTYIIYTSVSQKRSDPEIQREMKSEMKQKRLSNSVWLTSFLSGFFIYLGAKYTVSSVLELSHLFGVGSEIIAVTAVAFGTSLPELSVTVAAAKKGKAEIAVGNILGSNIFNSLAVMGIPALFGPLVIPPSILSFSLPVMLVASLLYLFMTQDKLITKWEGWFLVIFYIFFIGKITGLA